LRSRIVSYIMKEQGINPGYRTEVETAEVETAEGGNDKGDMNPVSSLFFLNREELAEDAFSSRFYALEL